MHTVHSNLPAAPKPPKAGLIKLGIIGLGNHAKLLAQAAANSEKIKIVAAHSRSEQERRSFQTATRVPVVSDLNTLLSYPMLDGVILDVPVDQHLWLATEIAKTKRHIYLESPIASTREEADQICALEQKYGITVSVACYPSLLAGVRKIRELIRGGELGSVHLLEVSFTVSDAERSGSQWNTPVGSAVLPAPLARIAFQQFEILQFLGGEIANISAITGAHSASNAQGKQLLVLLGFQDGKFGYAGSSLGSTDTFSLRVVGSKAAIHFATDPNNWGVAALFHENSVLRVQRTTDSTSREKVLEVAGDDVFRAALEAFAEACRTGKAPQRSAANANAALTLLSAAVQSIRRNSAPVALESAFQTQK